MLDFLKSLFKSSPRPPLKKVPGHALYCFGGCPYCVMVQQVMKQLSLDIEIRNIYKDKQHLIDLEKGGGSHVVPCLRIETQSGVRWLYESADIIRYLRREFPVEVPANSDKQL